MLPGNPRERVFSVKSECRYLLSIPEESQPARLVVALHGFGSSPEAMLRLAAPVVGGDAILASLQAPSAFYTGQGGRDVGYCWATHKHSETSVRMHHEILLHVLAELGMEFGVPPARIFLLGFSQPVGLNYRFAATHDGRVRGVIGICGGVPSNWEAGPYGRVSAALLHIARRDDEFYPSAVTETYPGRLRARADDVEFHLLEGGHRFPSRAKPILDQWFERLAAAGQEARMLPSK